MTSTDDTRAAEIAKAFRPLAEMGDKMNVKTFAKNLEDHLAAHGMYQLATLVRDARNSTVPPPSRPPAKPVAEQPANPMIAAWNGRPFELKEGERWNNRDWPNHWIIGCHEMFESSYPTVPIKTTIDDFKKCISDQIEFRPCNSTGKRVPEWKFVKEGERWATIGAGGQGLTYEIKPNEITTWPYEVGYSVTKESLETAINANPDDWKRLDPPQAKLKSHRIETGQRWHRRTTVGPPIYCITNDSVVVEGEPKSSTWGARDEFESMINCEPENWEILTPKPKPMNEASVERPITKEDAMQITDEMVTRFLCWPLPKSVRADPCASMPNYQFERTGTCLLDAIEARQMLEYVLQTSVAKETPAELPPLTPGERAVRTTDLLEDLPVIPWYAVQIYGRAAELIDKTVKEERAKAAAEAAAEKGREIADLRKQFSVSSSCLAACEAAIGRIGYAADVKWLNPNTKSYDTYEQWANRVVDKLKNDKKEQEGRIAKVAKAERENIANEFEIRGLRTFVNMIREMGEAK